MDAPFRENFETAQEIPCNSHTVSPGSFIAKLSIIAAVIVIVLNLSQVTVFENRSAALRLVQLLALVAVLTGVISASAGLFKAWTCHDSNVIILATVGLLLNGSLLATGFIKPPVKGSVSQTAKNTRTSSSQSGRSVVAVVTQDWTAGQVTELTDTTFDNALNDRVVLIDCWASWCGPCRKMSPIIDALAEDYQGSVKVCKLNVDQARKTAAKLGVRNIPTILLYKNGRLCKKWIGVTDKSAIMLEINKLM